MEGMLTIMGSGETAPTMVSTHREVLAAVSDGAGRAVLLDTPYGFQENADEITNRAVGYFETSVGRHIEPLTLRSVAGAAPADIARFEAGLETAGFVFSGPGSPTYAIEQWKPLRVAEILAAVIRRGGAVTFASAAAVTLGVRSLPVYEIYKAGRPPYWADGLDLLGSLGIDAVVIPHFDNAEGGTHDTRYCYMGQRRLEALEALLPAGTSVIGVDEHTACVIDFGRGDVRVAGRGSLTVRVGGTETVVAGGTTAPLEVLSGAVEGIPATVPHNEAAVGPERQEAGVTPSARKAGAAFDEAMAAGDGAAAAAEALVLEQAITDWAADTLESDALDRARSLLRTMVVRLGDAAADGLIEPRTRFAPYVEALLAARDHLRSAGDYTGADAVRDRLLALGVEVRDGPAGPEWLLGDG